MLGRTLSIVSLVMGLGLVVGSVSGCSEPIPQVVEVPSPEAEIPIVALPELLREWNWQSKQRESYGEGSCVIASSCSLFKWLGEHELAAHFRKTYAGGQTASSIQKIWTAEGLSYCATEGGDPDHLDWCSRTRRGAIIWFFPYHCVTFCGFGRVGESEYAFLLDNNRNEKFLRVPREEFVRRWREYGGFAATPLLSPTGPLPWPAYVSAQ